MIPKPTIADLFAVGRSEQEYHWQESLFITPSIFTDLAGSFAVFGTTGSGKTALQLALRRRAIAQSVLVADWLPVLPREHANFSGDMLARQALATCLTALIIQLGQEPERLVQTHAWVGETITWLTHHCLPEIRVGSRRRLGRLLEHATPEGQELLDQLLLAPLADEELRDVSDIDLLKELTEILSRLGYRSLLLQIDDLDRLSYQGEQRTIAIQILLASLELFDIRNLEVKIVASEDLQAVFEQSRVVQRRRLMLHRLHWTETQLVALLERRLALLTNQTFCKLAEIAPEQELRAWLIMQGPMTPRNWLERTRPFIDLFAERGFRKLEQAEILPLLQRVDTVAPQLRVDHEFARVFINRREIFLQPQSYRLLQYLDQHRGRLCSRSELYYHALRELAYVPRSHNDKGYEEPANWEGRFTSALNRLREAIEPDTTRPRFITTIRGQGIRLELDTALGEEVRAR